jgi:hypothetical protein
VPKIAYPEAQAVVDAFEDLVTACEDYIAYLEEQRPLAFRSPERSATGANVNGRFRWNPLPEPAPEYGTPEFLEFGYNRHLVKNVGRTQFLLDLLEGDGYDRLRQIVDGLGTLEAARKGEWV